MDSPIETSDRDLRAQNRALQQQVQLLTEELGSLRANEPPEDPPERRVDAEHSKNTM